MVLNNVSLLAPVPVYPTLSYLFNFVILALIDISSYWLLPSILHFLPSFCLSSQINQIAKHKVILWQLCTFTQHTYSIINSGSSALEIPLVFPSSYSSYYISSGSDLYSVADNIRTDLDCKIFAMSILTYSILKSSSYPHANAIYQLSSASIHYYRE